MRAGEEMYRVWAPEESVWSAWVKPVMFVAARGTISTMLPVAGAREELTIGEWLPKGDGGMGARPGVGLVVNVAGELALRLGVALAAMGYRPVPLFNACNGGPQAAVEMGGVARYLEEGTALLEGLPLAADAPPAFLLDAGRCPALSPMPGQFDNRWLVFPQDFPSGRFLAEHGIEEMMLVEKRAYMVQEDLSHVLKRWEQAGIRLRRAEMESGVVRDLEVPRPRWFRAWIYRVLMLLRLRRSAVGGFGSVVPTPGSGGG